MTPNSRMSDKANMAKGLVKDVLGRTGGQGRTGGTSRTGGQGGSGTDMRRMALKAREAFRK